MQCHDYLLGLISKGVIRSITSTKDPQYSGQMKGNKWQKDKNGSQNIGLFVLFILAEFMTINVSGKFEDTKRSNQKQ